MKANMHWLVMQDRGHKQMTKHERMTKRRCFACPFVILPLPAGKFPLQPVDKTRHGREETAARFRRDRWRWFFGSHLTDRLLAEGHRVIAIDNLVAENTANIGLGKKTC